MTEVQRDNTKKWIDALRSGRYTQTTRRLKLEDNGEFCHCAQGVALEEFGFESEDCGYNHDGKRVWLFHVFDGMSTASAAYHELRQLTGMEYHVLEEVVDRNDGGEDFNSIADYIESEMNK